MRRYMPTEYPETNISKSFKRKLWQLAKELMKEDTSPNSTSEAECYRKLFNKDRTGLIDKLKDDLNFDIIAIAGEDKTQQQSAIDLLKILFEMEKEKKFKIIDFLAHPSMQNFVYVYPHSSKIEKSKSYKNSGKILDFFSDFKEYMAQYDEKGIELREKVVSLIDERWDLNFSKITGYVLSNISRENIQTSIEALDQIENFLNSKILPELSGKFSDTLHHDSVMQMFYTILLSHKIQCTNADMIQISQEILYDESPTDDFIQLLQEHETEWIDTGKIQKFQKYLFSQKKNKVIIPEYELLLSLISHQQGYNPEEKGAYKFALENFMTIVKWWSERYPQAKRLADDGRTGISIVTFVNIIQEMLFVKRNNETISNKYYGYNNPNSSLRKAVLKPKEAEPKAIAAWISKIENRTAVNFGSAELIIKKREIEAAFYQIKEFIYSQHNLADIEDVSESISHLIAQKFVQDIFCTSWTDFSENIASLLSRLNPDLKRLTITLSPPLTPRNPKFYDMLYEFFLCRDDAKEAIVSKIAEKIKICNEELNRKRYILPVTIKYSENHIQQYVLFFSFDPNANTLCFQNFLPESRFKK